MIESRKHDYKFRDYTVHDELDVWCITEKDCPSSAWVQYPDGICYMKFGALPGSYDFNTAKTSCENAGGHLPSFHNADEWEDFLRHTYVHCIMQCVGRREYESWSENALLIIQSFCRSPQSFGTRLEDFFRFVAIFL